MGLDMYLRAKRFLWKNDSNVQEKLLDVFPEFKGKSFEFNEVIMEAMYWRKANAIHKWFVDNCQDGNDDCGYYYVSRDKLEELRDIILESLETKDSSNLPPAAGFFFESTDVNDYYWDDLKHTAEEIDECLKSFGKEWDFEYHSSW